MGVLATAVKPATAKACVRACECHASYAHISVIASCSQEQRSGSLWPYFIDGLGCRAFGCEVRDIFQLTATYFAMRPLVWRENAARRDAPRTVHTEYGLFEVMFVCAGGPVELSQTSVTVRACTVVGTVSVVCSAVRFLRTLRS